MQVEAEQNVASEPRTTNHIRRHGRPSRLADWRPRAVRVIILWLSAVLVLGANGLLPGMTKVLPATLSGEGALRCLARHGLTTLPNCPDLGLPLGQPLVDGMVTDTLGGLFDLLPFVGADVAFRLMALTVVVLSLYGMWLILRPFGVKYGLAIAAGALYLASPSVIGLAAFGATLWGFMLLPTYVAVDLIVAERWAAASWRERLLLVMAQIIAKVSFVFVDGYSFVVCAAISSCLLISFFWRKSGRWTTVASIAAFLAANGAAYLAYQVAIPGGSDFAKTPIDFFRAMGLDLTTLVHPTGNIWWGTRFGVAANFSTLWGDGSNASFNYVGVICLVLAVVGMVVARKSRIAWALFAAGVITFIMALGPSVKVGDHRPLLGSEVTYQSYLMPASDGELTMPTSVLYEHAPGVSAMRGTYRWFLGTRFILIAFAAVGTQALLTAAAQRRHAGYYRAGVGLLAIAAVVELMPPVRTTLHSYRVADGQRREINAVSTQLAHAIPAGSLVAFTAGGTAGNDFLVNYFGPMGGYRTYNTGGDKNFALSRPHWPDAVRDLILGKNTAEAADRVFAEGLAEAIVVPRFDLRWSAYRWPPAQTYIDRGDGVAASLRADPALSVTRYDWFYLVRPA